MYMGRNKKAEKGVKKTILKNHIRRWQPKYLEESDEKRKILRAPKTEEFARKYNCLVKITRQPLTKKWINRSSAIETETKLPLPNKVNLPSS